MAPTFDEMNSAPRRMPAQKRPRRFEPPNEFTPQMGVLVATAEHIQGVVKTEDIPALLEAFSIDVGAAVPMPFQKIVKQHGEFSSLRIEPSAFHTVEDALVVGHQWSYHKDQPGHTAQPA